MVCDRNQILAGLELTRSSQLDVIHNISKVDLSFITFKSARKVFADDEVAVKESFAQELKKALKSEIGKTSFSNLQRAAYEINQLIPFCSK